MSLSQEQMNLLEELKATADAFERLMNEVPEDIRDTWYKLVGYIREHFYMDETWDGKTLLFFKTMKPPTATSSTIKLQIFSMTIENDKISVSIMGTKDFVLRTPAEVDEVIATIPLYCSNPDRVLPNDNIVISKGQGRCDLCLWNSETLKRDDRRWEMSVGFAKCYGFVNDFTVRQCDGTTPDCRINDIGAGTPGLTAEEITHSLLPYWWTSRRRKEL